MTETIEPEALQGKRLSEEPLEAFITHARPHVDEILAIGLFRMYGTILYPEIASGAVGVTERGGNYLKPGETHEDHPRVIFVGCAGSPFDEHNRRGPKSCAASRVGKYLGVDKKPALQKILYWNLIEDSTGQRPNMSVAGAVNLLHEIMQLTEVYAWYFTLLEAEILEGEELHQKLSEEEWQDHIYKDPTDLLSGRALIKKHHGKEVAKAWYSKAQEALENKNALTAEALGDFRRDATTSRIQTPQGSLRVAMVVTDNPAMVRAVRGTKEFDLLVTKTPRGNIQIFGLGQGLDLGHLAGIIRLVEMRRKGPRHITTSDMAKLSVQGTFPDVPHWHLQEKEDCCDVLLNGSLTTPNTTPTELTLEDIHNLLKITFGMKYHQDRYLGCRDNICDRNCPWFAFELARCMGKKVR